MTREQYTKRWIKKRFGTKRAFRDHYNKMARERRKRQKAENPDEYRELIRTYGATYRKTHHEEYKEYQREYQRKWKAAYKKKHGVSYGVRYYKKKGRINK